jgi:hypothetical protein
MPDDIYISGQDGTLYNLNQDQADNFYSMPYGGRETFLKSLGKGALSGFNPASTTTNSTSPSDWGSLSAAALANAEPNPVPTNSTTPSNWGSLSAAALANAEPGPVPTITSTPGGTNGITPFGPAKGAVGVPQPMPPAISVGLPPGMNLTGTGEGHVAPKAERVAYYRDVVAPKYGLNPDALVSMLGTEGLHKYVGDNGTSFGDGQLHVGGGLGDAALNTGINIRDPNTWQQQADFIGQQLVALKGKDPRAISDTWHGIRNPDGTPMWQAQAMFTPGVTGPSTGTNPMYPPFGNQRALASLTPAGAGGTNPAASDVASSPATSTVGAAADPTAQLMKLLNGTGGGYGFNPSKMLASMAAGFLGGKGPAASLAGGFGGVASSQKDDSSELMQLVKMSMMYGPIMQANLAAKKLAGASALARSGTPLGTAMQLSGAELPPGETVASLNEQSRSAMPLPAGAQKTVQTALDDMKTQRQNQQLLMNARDEVVNGQVHFDPKNRLEYNIENTMGMPGPEGQKFIAQKQMLANMQGDLMNSQKGASSDKRAQMAMEQLTGSGPGLTSDAQAINHYNYLINHAGLAEKNLTNKVEQTYSLSKQKMPADFWDKVNANLPGSSLQPVDAQTLASHMYKDNSPGAVAPAKVGTGAATGMLTPAQQALIDKYSTPPATQ